MLQALELPHQVNTLAAGGGPGQALQELQRKGLCARKMAAWVQSARMDAILGGLQQTTMASLRSGLRCYIAFVGGIIFLHVHMFTVLTMFSAGIIGTCFPGTTSFFPPSLTCLLAWSVTFRSKGTFANYLGYVKHGCIMVGASTEV